jgi:hypothetical protein
VQTHLCVQNRAVELHDASEKSIKTHNPFIFPASLATLSLVSRLCEASTHNTHRQAHKNSISKQVEGILFFHFGRCVRISIVRLCVCVCVFVNGQKTHFSFLKWIFFSRFEVNWQVDVVHVYDCREIYFY